MESAGLRQQQMVLAGAGQQNKVIQNNIGNTKILQQTCVLSMKNLAGTGKLERRVDDAGINLLQNVEYDPSSIKQRGHE